MVRLSDTPHIPINNSQDITIINNNYLGQPYISELQSTHISGNHSGYTSGSHSGSGFMGPKQNYSTTEHQEYTTKNNKSNVDQNIQNISKPHYPPLQKASWFSRQSPSWETKKRCSDKVQYIQAPLFVQAREKRSQVVEMGRKNPSNHSSAWPNPTKTSLEH